MGSIEIPMGKGNFGGRPAHWKALVVSAAVYAAKGIIQSSIMARHAMRPFVKVLLPLVFSLVRVFVTQIRCPCATGYYRCVVIAALPTRDGTGSELLTHDPTRPIQWTFLKSLKQGLSGRCSQSAWLHVGPTWDEAAVRASEHPTPQYLY